MIFDIPMGPMNEDQKHRHSFTRVMVIIPLNFAGCTQPTHRNRQMKSSLNCCNCSPSFENIYVFMTVAILAAIFLV